MFGEDISFIIVFEKLEIGLSLFSFCMVSRYAGFFDDLSRRCAFATISVEMFAYVLFPFLTCIRFPEVTWPITEHVMRNFLQISCSFFSFCLPVIINILSCDSDIIISSGCIPGSLVCTLSTSISIPIPKVSAVSETAQDNPPPPRSFNALIRW